MNFYITQNNHQGHHIPCESSISWADEHSHISRKTLITLTRKGELREYNLENNEHISSRIVFESKLQTQLILSSQLLTDFICIATFKELQLYKLAPPYQSFSLLSPQDQKTYQTMSSKAISCLMQRKAQWLRVLGRIKKQISLWIYSVSQYGPSKRQHSYSLELPFEIAFEWCSHSNCVIFYPTIIDKFGTINCRTLSFIATEGGWSELQKEYNIIQFEERCGLVGADKINDDTLVLLSGGEGFGSRLTNVIVYDCRKKHIANMVRLDGSLIREMTVRDYGKENAYIECYGSVNSNNSEVYQVYPLQFQDYQSTKLKGQVVHSFPSHFLTQSGGQLLFYPKINKKQLYAGLIRAGPPRLRSLLVDVLDLLQH